MRLWPLSLLVLSACGMWNSAGAFLGLVGAIVRAGPEGDPPATAGILLGGGAALLAAAAWCALTVRNVLRQLRGGRPATGKLAAAGAGWGSVLGVGTALIVHAGLLCLDGPWAPTALGAAALVGAVVGAALGVVGGLLARLAAAGTVPKQRSRAA